MSTVRKIAASVALCAMCMVTVLPTAAKANDLGYSVDFSSDLWLIDFTAGTSSLIGNTGLAAPIVEGIALRSDGTLFGTNGTAGCPDRS